MKKHYATVHPRVWAALKKGQGSSVRVSDHQVACGGGNRRDAVYATRDPQRVTCGNCQRTLTQRRTA